jgi:E3 ubiquitin-protein ligase UBR1
MNGISYMFLSNGPACAAATTRANLLTTVVDVMHSWYTNQVDDHTIRLPTADVDRSDPSPDARPGKDKSISWKNKRGIHLFAHLRGLLLHEEIQDIIVNDTDIFIRIVQFLNMFVGMQPQRREVIDHIAFEVEWIKTFGILGELAKCSRELGECFLRVTTPEKLVNALSLVGQRILCDISLLTNILDGVEYPPLSIHEVRDVLVQGSKHHLINKNTLAMVGLSFHHYLHYLFAELIKAVPKVIDFSSSTTSQIPSTTPNAQTLSFPDMIERFVLVPQTPEAATHLKLLLIENPLESECHGCHGPLHRRIHR